MVYGIYGAYANFGLRWRRGSGLDKRWCNNSKGCLKNDGLYKVVVIRIRYACA